MLIISFLHHLRLNCRLSLGEGMADVFTATKRSWVMSRIRGQDTVPELVVRRILHSMGYSFRLHRSDLPGTPDIVLPKHRAAIFVHGCFWHAHSCLKGRRPQTNKKFWTTKLKQNVRRDIRNARELRRLGWKRIVIWECETRKSGRVERRLTRMLGQTNRMAL